jgi:hypothetical protein
MCGRDFVGQHLQFMVLQRGYRRPHCATAALTIVAAATILCKDVDMNAIYESKSMGLKKSMELNNNLAPLLSQVRMAMLSGVDQEFLHDKDVASLEVTAAQFVIIANVLKGHAISACELCKFMDYDRGAMSRMIFKPNSCPGICCSGSSRLL